MLRALIAALMAIGLAKALHADADPGHLVTLNTRTFDLGIEVAKMRRDPDFVPMNEIDWLKPILDQWLASGRDYVICGDWNIVHTARDIKNWKSNQKNSGCLPEERDWLNALCADHGQTTDVTAGRGWADAYRLLNPTGEDYTWWSNRGAARANNVGWRIDYQFITPGLRDRLRSCSIYRDERFSDHAPFTVDYDL